MTLEEHTPVVRASVLRSIWAQSRTGAIGDRGGMLWQLPEDMAYFKRATSGLPVIMGRRTWESFPERFRPLPDRTNIVVTRTDGYEAPGAEVVATIDEALTLAASVDDEVWVIGGATIYEQTLPIVDEVWVTEVDTDAEGDAHAPTLDESWVELRREPPGPDGWLTSRVGTRYRYVVHGRRDTLDA